MKSLHIKFLLLGIEIIPLKIKRIIRQYILHIKVHYPNTVNNKWSSELLSLFIKVFFAVTVENCVHVYHATQI